MRLLKIIAVFLIVAVLSICIGSYFFLKHFDLNQYKTTIEDIVYKNTGRKLTINGNAHLGISLIPSLIVDDIELSNASWASQPQMVKLKSLKVQVSVLPLLKKRLVIDSVILQQPEIYLEQAENGMNNWTFSAPETQTAHAETLAFAQKEIYALAEKSKPAVLQTAFLKDFSINNVTLENGFIEYQTPKQTEKLQINNITFSMKNLDSPINADINVILHNYPLTASVNTDSVNTLFAADTPFNVNIDGQAAGIDILLKGYAENILNKISYKFNANVYNPAGNFSAPETTLETTVEGNLSVVKAAIKTLNIANNFISGSVSADISKNIPFVQANLSSPSFDLRSLQPNEPLAFDFSLISEASATELVPNTAVPYNELKKVNADINLNIKTLIINNAMTADNVNLAAVLNNGVLNVKPLSLDFGGGKLNLDLNVNANNKSIALKLNSNDILLQNLHKEFQVSGNNDFGIISGGKTMLDIDLTSNGDTYRRLAENLRGQSVVLLDKSEVQTGSLQFLTGNFISQLLNTLQIKTSSKNIAVQCAVVRTDFKDGKAIFPNGIAVQSNSLTIASTGNMNLINDKIDFSITPTVDFKTNLAQALSSLVKIGGTVQNPKIMLDDKQALQTIVGVATTGGAAYLGSQFVTSSDTPCYAALNGTTYQKLVPQPSEGAKLKNDVVNNTGQAVKDTTNAIKGELKSIEKNAKDFLNILKGKQ